MTGKESALSPEELQAEESLKRKLENLSGGRCATDIHCHGPSDHPTHSVTGRDVVCHVVTTYFGKRQLTPAEVSEGKQFAWLGHLFVEHPHHEV